MSSWGRLKGLSGADWRLLVAALVMLPWVALQLRARGLKHIQSKRTGMPCREPRLVHPEMAEARRIARMTNLAAYHGPYRARCLERSLTLQWFLDRRGLPSDLKLGARRLGDCVGAHAWVECAGQVLNDDHDVRGRYHVLN